MNCMFIEITNHCSNPLSFLAKDLPTLQSVKTGHRCYFKAVTVEYRKISWGQDCTVRVTQQSRSHNLE